MEFHAFHGCMEHEQMLGNTFIVSISMMIDTQLAGQTDKLEDTLNYQLVYDVVKEQMEIRSKLIEHVGQRILDKIMNKFPNIQALEVCLLKERVCVCIKYEYSVRMTNFADTIKHCVK